MKSIPTIMLLVVVFIVIGLFFSSGLRRRILYPVHSLRSLAGSGRLAAAELGLALGFIVFIALGLFAIFILPQLIIPPTVALEREGRLKLENDVRTTLIQALVGLGALIATMRTWLGVQSRRDRTQLEVSRQEQLTERFTRAVGQLGNASIEVRLGAIYGLERIALDSPADRSSITDILAGYVRGHSPWPPQLPGQYVADAPITEVPPLRVRAADVQAVMTILGRRPLFQVTSFLDLANVDLRVADLPGANLPSTDLRASNLGGAYLNAVNLQQSNLAGANLESAWFGAAVLRNANMSNANLRQAILREADLRSVVLAQANLSGASLGRANLEGADLTRANLENADLTGANLEGARLDDTQM